MPISCFWWLLRARCCAYDWLLWAGPGVFQIAVSKIFAVTYNLLNPILYIFIIRVALKFGIITCIAGFLGVGLGSESARRLRVKYRRADPLVCAFGLLSCAPFLFFAMVLSKYHTVTTWVSHVNNSFAPRLINWKRFWTEYFWHLLTIFFLNFLPDTNICWWNVIVLKLGYSHWHNLGKCWTVHLS